MDGRRGMKILDLYPSASSDLFGLMDWGYGFAFTPSIHPHKPSESSGAHGMNRTHDITKRDFLVYVDGFGIYINVLFAEKHGIREGSSIGKSLMDTHHTEVPPMDCTSSHIWLTDEQKEQGDMYFNLNPYSKVGTIDGFADYYFDKNEGYWVKKTT